MGSFFCWCFVYCITYITRKVGVIRNTPNDCCEMCSKSFYGYLWRLYTQQYLTKNMALLPLHYEAAMVLSGVGDALGFKSGSWKFYKVGNDILEELKSMGGLSALNVKRNITLNLVSLSYTNNNIFFISWQCKLFLYSKIWWYFVTRL